MPIYTNFPFLICCLIFLGLPVSAIDFAIKDFAKTQKISNALTLKEGEIEFINFDSAVELIYHDAHEIFEIVPQKKSKNKYSFLVKAIQPGFATITFKHRNSFSKLNINIERNLDYISQKLNKEFSHNNNLIKVISNPINNNILLTGTVSSPEESLMAITFAAQALNDPGIKIYADGNGQLVNGLSQEIQSNISPQSTTNNSFADTYQFTHNLTQPENLYRDIILSSTNEKVISYLKVNEPNRYSLKIRFMEVEAKFIDNFFNTVIMTSTDNILSGAIGSNTLSTPNLNDASSGFTSARNSSAISAAGIINFASQVLSGNVVGGTLKLFDSNFLNVILNGLVEQGVMKLINEFNLISHPGETVSVGKGIRFPLPRINSSVGGNNISIEYIPLGFQGEVRLNELQNGLIDIQLSSRLSVPQPTSTVVEGLVIPTFREQFVNSGALLKNGEEVIINTFVTEDDNKSKSRSLLAKFLPFLGSTKQRKRGKNILLVSLQASKIANSSQIHNNQVPIIDLDNIELDNTIQELTNLERESNTKFFSPNKLNIYPVNK